MGEVIGGLSGPVAAIREATPQALHHYTRFDQVNQLVSASEADAISTSASTALTSWSWSRGLTTNCPTVACPACCWPGSRPKRCGPKAANLSWVILSGFMRKLGMSDDSGSPRGDRTRLRNQMRRLFGCSVQLIYEDERVTASMTSPVAARAEFWWNERKPDEPVLFNSKIRLGEDLFNEIINHPVPLDMNTLKALKRSALGLDLYLWLTYRTFMLNRPLRLTWQQVYRQFGAHPDNASDKRTVLNFRSKVLRELKKIKMAWPEVNYSTAPGVLILHPSTPGIAPLNHLNSSLLPLRLARPLRNPKAQPHASRSASV